MSKVDGNAGQRTPGGVTGKGFVPGQSGCPGGVPKWVKQARDAMRDELWPLAQRHLRRVLSGERPDDSTKAEDAMYSDVTVEDRTMAAKLVVEYTMPKPKQAQTHRVQAGEGGGSLEVVVKTLASGAE